MAVLLILGSIAVQLIEYFTGHGRLLGLSRFLNVGAEQNLPTAFSTLLLLFASLLLAVISALEWKRHAPVLHWAILSCGFAFMAVDEAWQIHERLIDPVRRLLPDQELGIFFFAWVIPGIAVVLVLAVVFSKFLWRLPRSTRLAFLAAGSLYLGGAIGMEMIGGSLAEVDDMSFTYRMVTNVEEGLEMAGLVLFIWALLAYMADHYHEVRVRLEPEAASTADGKARSPLAPRPVKRPTPAESINGSYE